MDLQLINKQFVIALSFWAAQAVCVEAQAQGGSLAAAFSGSSTGDVCRGEDLKNLPFVQAMSQLNKDSPNVQLRAAMVGIDLQLDAYRRCRDNPRAQNMISQLEDQRVKTLQTCRQISSTDNCLQPPF